MTRIPAKLRKQLAADTFYTRCCITGEQGTRADPIEWHHNLIFAGKQVQARFAILPLLKSVHERIHEQELKDKADWVMWNRASTEDLLLYGKGVNYGDHLERLNQKYGYAYKEPLLVAPVEIAY